MELRKNELNTVLFDALLLTVMLLSPSTVSPTRNSVIGPSMRVLIHAIVGKGNPSAEQLRERCCGLRSWMALIGDIVILG